MKSEVEIRAWLENNKALIAPESKAAMSGDQKRKLELEIGVLEKVLND